MNNNPVISLVLNAHIPFIRHPEQTDSLEERLFFEAVSDTYIPLLEMFDRLDRDRVPFRMGISLSPTLCHMLSDSYLLSRYLAFTDKQIEFGADELKRRPDDALAHTLRQFYDRMLDKRVLFTERYQGNLLNVFDYYQKKGKLELVLTAATHAFLPFYTAYPEAIQAEIEVAIGAYRNRFGKNPQGFWLPEMGWSPELDPWLRSYNFAYTMVETHGMVFGHPCAEKGSFYPAKTPSGIFILGRDFHANEDREALSCCSEYRDNKKDLGFELSPDLLKSFLGTQGGRGSTGYKCRTKGGAVYNFEEAGKKAQDQARIFLQNRRTRLSEAQALMDKPPLSLCAFDADSFGRCWYEGPQFLETMFREGAGVFQFMTPAEYLYKQDSSSFQTLTPEFSSWGVNGFGETWADASNDWIYRHTTRALERMIEISDRFPDNSGLKERTLNQAAREILLSMASDWPSMLYKQENSVYARTQAESCLRNFTTIYEALGSNYISTEWLTSLEKRHNIFPNINYRVFRRKK